MGLVSFLINYIAPIFIVISPITSYADQIWSIHRTRSSHGFSLDIPLIMLVASILRVYYWFGARFDTALLIQAAIMIVMQMALLKVALDYRPPPTNKGGINSAPFAGSREGELGVVRPYNFWQWRNPKPYWEFLFYLALGLLAFQLVLPVTPLYGVYTVLIGYVALGVEATLPLPQILSNQRSRSCKGFRFSVLFSWILGDVMKMVFFTLSESSIPWAFKLCGLFQFGCDIYLGVQYWQFGDGPAIGRVAEEAREKDYRLS